MTTAPQTSRRNAGKNIRMLPPLRERHTVCFSRHIQPTSSFATSLVIIINPDARIVNHAITHVKQLRGGVICGATSKVLLLLLLLLFRRNAAASHAAPSSPVSKCSIVAKTAAA
jgi:hypothetical protein